MKNPVFAPLRLCASICWLLLAACSSTPEERADRVELLGDIVDEVIARYDDADDLPPVVIAPPKQSDAGDTSKPNPQVEGSPDVPPAPSSDEFAGITKFRNSADCSKWPVTVAISNAYIRGGNIYWTEAAGQREARGWNRKSSGGKTIDGECILVLPSRGEAGMFDFLRVGQTMKLLANLKPSREGAGFFAPWNPDTAKGERIGFCIATISRDKPHAKMQERSNVVWLTVP